MSHISTSKNCYLKEPCRKIALHKVTDGNKVVGLIDREEKALNRKLRVLDSEEQRAFNKLDNQIKNLKNRRGLPWTAEGAKNGVFDEQDHFQGPSNGKTWAANMHEDREGCRVRESKPALSRFPSSPALLQRRRCELKKHSPLSRSLTELQLNRSGEMTKRTESVHNSVNSDDSGQVNLRPKIDSGFLPKLTTPSASWPLSKKECWMSSHIRRKRSASLNDAMFTSSLQDLRDPRPDSRQKTRASSLLVLSDSSAQRTVNGGVDHEFVSRRSRLPASPLANRRRLTNRSCSCHKLTDALNKNADTASCQPDNDPNSAEALSSCRYLRIPLFTTTASNNSGSD